MRNSITQLRFQPHASRMGGLLWLLVGLVLASCTGPSNEDIARFAQSGVAFTNQTPRVYDYAFQEAIRRDNADLLRQRQKLRSLDLSGASLEEAKDSLADQYDANLSLFSERLEDFRVMKAHAAKLGSYFVSLNALASGASSEAAGNAANGLANQVAVLAPEVKAISIGGANINSLIGPLTELAVASFANARLQDHLEEHADSVREAIALQRSMLELLLQIETDRAQVPMEVGLKQSFLNLDRDLPREWGQIRQQSFNFQLQPNPISAALIAARELEGAFAKLVEGGQGALASLERSIVLVETIMNIYQASQQGVSQ